MASCSTSRWVSTAPYITLTVNVSSQTNTTATLSWTLQYIASSAAQTNKLRTYSVVVAGATVKSGSYSIDGKKGTFTIASGTKTINKSTSTQTISFSCSMAFNLTWSGVYGGTKSASGSLSVAAKPSYKITYNANGGSGAPGQQTKWAGSNITLSMTRPTRAGHSFQGWSKSAGGGVAYQPGATYSSDSSITLYAVWKANTYTVSYNANGGTGAPSNQTKTYGVDLILSKAIPTRTNYNFKGWGTSASSTSIAYAAGATYKNDTSITLYAIWELAYTPPRIKNLRVDRYDVGGTITDEGEYAGIHFEWETDKEIQTIISEWKEESATDDQYQLLMSHITDNTTGTSGLVDYVVTQKAFNAENSWSIRITVTDTIGSETAIRVLPPMAFEIDFLVGGNGVAFGKPATKKGIMDSAFIPNFSPSLIGGENIAEGTDLNTIKMVGNYSCYDAIAKTLVNCPSDRGFHMEVGYAYNDNAYIYQEITGGLSAITWYRRCFIETDAWSEWITRPTMTSISGSTDLNNVIMPGFYSSPGGNPNTPSSIYSSTFTLEVLPAGTDGQLIQRITRCHKGLIDVLERVYYKSTWGDWWRASSLGYRILWSGGYYMTGGHVARLSETVSSQAHGICLLFSTYVNGGVSNQQFTSIFVPKDYVNNVNGAGLSCNLTSHWKHGMKYLYIKYEEILGNDLNGQTRTLDGVTYDNAAFVLRYVIGI